MSYDYQPPRKPLTHNGESWGTNAGHVGQGLMYGWALKRGIEAEQRRAKVIGENPWTPALTVGKVFVLNCIHVWVWIVHAYFIINILAWPFMTIDEGGDVRKNIILLFVGSLPAAVLTRAAQAAFGDAKRIREGLPPKKAVRWLAPRNMVALAILPLFYLIALMVVSNIVNGQ